LLSERVNHRPLSRWFDFSHFTPFSIAIEEERLRIIETPQIGRLSTEKGQFGTLKSTNSVSHSGNQMRFSRCFYHSGRCQRQGWAARAFFFIFKAFFAVYLLKLAGFGRFLDPDFPRYPAGFKWGMIQKHSIRRTSPST
jgi:hypothetical protein